MDSCHSPGHLLTAITLVGQLLLSADPKSIANFTQAFTTINKLPA